MSDENQNLIELESQAIEDYLANIYAKKVPEPEKPTADELSFWRIAGISTTLFVLAALGVVAFSSIRTGGLFYILELTLLKKFSLGDWATNGLSLGSMIASLFAFELTSLAIGYSKGEESTSLVRSKAALIASQLVIITAGIFTGLGLIPNLDNSWEIAFYVFTALATAVAGGVVSYYSGDNLGYGVKKVELKRQDLKDAHRIRYQEWREAGVRSYGSSHFAVGSDKANAFANKIGKFKINSNQNYQMNEESQGSNQGSNAVQNEPVIEPKLGKSELAEIAIGKFVESQRRLPTVEELKTSSGVSQGTASKSISGYVLKNADYLIENKFINEARLAMYQNSNSATE